MTGLNHGYQSEERIFTRVIYQDAGIAEEIPL